MSKTDEESFYLIDEMASNNCQWHMVKLVPKKVTGVVDLDIPLQHYKIKPIIYYWDCLKSWIYGQFG